MSKRQILFTAGLSSLFTLTLLAGLLLFFSQVSAAPGASSNQTELGQNSSGTFRYVSISGLAFVPANQGTTFTKDAGLQLLSLTNPVRNFGPNPPRFVAPLLLPDRSELVGLTVFGQDADNLGEVRLRLKRCNHGQPFCVNLAETTSTTDFATGRFETPRITIANEIVDNRFYSYYLELELSALGNSGLRSVRLEIIDPEAAPTPANKVQWSLSGSMRTIELPITGLTQVEICTDNLSHLPNPTHYPFIVADNQIAPLSSNDCEVIWGREIEIRRELNTGPSSGTYQFLR